jgi:hypothetical protein
MAKTSRTIRNRFLLKAAALPVLAVLLYLFLPVPFTVYTRQNDGTLHPADPIMSQTPLQQCFTGNFTGVTGIDVLLATYQRVNTNLNHAEIFTIQNNQKQLYFQEDFSSQNVRDNDYFSINFPPVAQTSKLCLLLTSADGTAQNSITYWLNSQSQPVLNLKSTVPLRQAIERIAGASRFDLPLWLAVALCLLYLSANLCAIFLICHDPRNQPQNFPEAPPPHSVGTRQKRI